MADSAKAATADARRTLLALACLLSAFFLNQVPPFVSQISVCLTTFNRLAFALYFYFYFCKCSKVSIASAFITITKSNLFFCYVLWIDYDIIFKPTIWAFYFYFQHILVPVPTQGQFQQCIHSRKYYTSPVLLAVIVSVS